jgi:pimeloyl-ACP methyl ester carboxylesterase
LAGLLCHFVEWVFIFKCCAARPLTIDLPQNTIAATGQSACAIEEEGYAPVDDGIQLFYRRLSDGGETVVVPLGFHLYEDFKQLARNRTVVFYDMRNRGCSKTVSNGEKITIQQDVEDLDKIRRHFGLEKMNLIGESYLGLMVMMYAMKYPEPVGRIVQMGWPCAAQVQHRVSGKPNSQRRQATARFQVHQPKESEQ